MTLLNEALRSASADKMLVYGAMLLFVILVFPGGLMSVFRQLKERTHKTGRSIQKNGEA